MIRGGCIVFVWLMRFDCLMGSVQGFFFSFHERSSNYFFIFSVLELLSFLTGFDVAHLCV